MHISHFIKIRSSFMVVPTELTCIEKVGTVWFRFFYSKDGNKNFIFADIWTHVCIFGGEEQSGGN